MATSEYRFTQSAPILRELARTTPRPPPPPPVTGSSEYTENVKPFEFIDESLSLLAYLQKDQDNLIRREFKQQHDLITGKFEQEQYDAGRRDQSIYQNFTKIQGQLENFKQNVRQRFEEVGQRFEEVGQRFEEVGQRFDRVETELDNFREEVGQRFDEMKARMFNSLSYRPHHQIHPVALLKNRRLQKPDVKSFPTDIKKFWKLQARENAPKRFHLLQFYSIEGYKHWNIETEVSDSDASDSSAESLTLEDAARSYPLKCLEALAARLGLDYDKICAEMERLQEYRQQTTAQTTAQPLKGQSADGTSKKISKRVRESSAASTKPVPHSKRPDKPRSLEVRSSPGSTDKVSETDFQMTEQRSQGSTEVFSFERSQSKS